MSEAVSAVSSLVTGERLSELFMQYGQILDVNSDNLNGRWSFDIILDRLDFVSVPKCIPV